MSDSLDASLLRSVAMFPLPNVVLLPGALVPLHIFEPRYRDMTRDVLDGSGLIAMARLRDGYEADYHGRPPVHETLGVGRVIASDELDDGRYNILVRGLVRARVVEEMAPETSYRRIRAEAIPDGEAAAEVLAALHRKLIVLCDQLADALDQGGEQLHELVRNESDPCACTDVVCAALVTEIDERQRLLETADPAERMSYAMHHVNRLIGEFGP